MPISIIVRRAPSTGDDHAFRPDTTSFPMWRSLCDQDFTVVQLRASATDLPTCTGCLIAWGTAEAAALDGKFGAALFSESGSAGAWA